MTLKCTGGESMGTSPTWMSWWISISLTLCSPSTNRSTRNYISCFNISGSNETIFNLYRKEENVMNAKAPTFLSVLGFFMQLKKHMLRKPQNIRHSTDKYRIQLHLTATVYLFTDVYLEFTCLDSHFGEGNYITKQI